MLPIFPSISSDFYSRAVSACLKHESGAVGRWFRTAVLWTGFVFQSRAQGGFILRGTFQWQRASQQSLKERQQKWNARGIDYKE